VSTVRSPVLITTFGRHAGLHLMAAQFLQALGRDGDACQVVRLVGPRVGDQVRGYRIHRTLHHQGRRVSESGKAHVGGQSRVDAVYQVGRHPGFEEQRSFCGTMSSASGLAR